jgi:hypothetical protein
MGSKMYKNNESMKQMMTNRKKNGTEEEGGTYSVE